MNGQMLNRHRNQRGFSVILLMTILAFFFVGVLGVFAFEVARINTARDELRSATEAAALSGAASLASSNSLVPTTAHNNAVAAALATFRSNSVVGTMLNNATQTSVMLNNPTAGQNSLFIEFLDPNNNYAPVTDYASTAGKVVHCVGDQGYIPAFGKYVGLSNYNIRGDAQASVPDLDIVMLFDTSASIDDQTPVTYVHRFKNNSNKVQYMIYDTGHQGSGNLVSGPLYTAIGCTKNTGSSVNGCPPQNLSSLNDNTDNRFKWDQTARGPSGGPDYGTLPGNSPYAAPPSGNITDEVVNIDGANVFANGSDNGSFSSNGLPFPNVATLVEAARGNLENENVFVSSGASTAVNGVPASVANIVNNSSGTGYNAAYLAAARKQAQPIGQAQQAALSFFNIMNTNTNACMGFLPFATNVYTTATSHGDSGNYVTSGYNSNVYYNGAVVGASNNNWPAFATPLLYNTSNYSTIVPQLTQTIANGGTRIDLALTTAGNLLQLQSAGGQSRKGAKRVIVLFTDGLNNLNNVPTPGPCYTAAQTMNAPNPSPNIAIYAIGLAQNTNVIQYEIDLLNSGGAGSTVTANGVPYTCGHDGVAKIAGNNGQFFLVTNAANLNYVFENIARQLVSLVRN